MILKEILTQYKNYIYLEDENLYSQLTISNNGVVSHRDIKKGAEIGRKRQFVIDLATNPHTLIFTRQGVVEGSIGIVPRELDGYIVTENMPMFSINTDIVNPQYLIMFLKSQEYKEQIRKIIPSGTAQKALHEDKWTLIEISLPPLKEQNQIVAKYLNCLADLEKVSLKTSKQEKYVSTLRQAILQQAVEGKLCEQNPTDEPASVLLKKIKAEKELLLKNKTEKEYFELEFQKVRVSGNRLYMRVELICDFITKGTTPKGNELLDVGEIPFLKVYNIVNNKINFSYRSQYISDTIHNTFLARSKVYPNDVITNIVGPPLGKVAIIPNDYAEWNVNQAIAIFRCLSYILPKYLYLVLLEGTSINSIVTVGTAGQDNISLAQCRDMMISLPPLAEQQRIVEKVDRLMALCDELEQEVVSAKKYATQLMQAVLQESFSNNKEKTTDNVIVFTPIQKPALESLLAAARGNMREDTWENLRTRALELASEES